MPRSRKTSVRSKFKKWLAVPKQKRKSATGIGTQAEFADKFGVAKATLSRWKKEPGFMNGVERTRRLHLDEALSEVYESMIQRAKEGDPQAMKMVMEQAGRYKEEVGESEDVSDDDVEGASNQKLASMVATMMSGPSQMSEAVLEARILDSLGEDIPDDIKDKIKEEEATEETPSEEVTEIDQDAVEDEEEDEATDESEDEKVNESEDEDKQAEFELEDHLMEDIDEEPDDFQVDYDEDPDEEDDLDDLETTEEFEMPLEW